MADTFAKQMGKRKDAVLTKEDVEAMIAVMGEPEVIADEDPVAPGGTATDAPSDSDGATGPSSAMPRRLYRDTDDVVVAGVASGLAAYLGTDPVIVRIGFILLTFVNGVGLLAYLILWAAMPKAETTAQKLEMRGKPVNLSAIEELVKKKAHMLRDEGTEAVNRLRNERTRSDSALHRILRIPVQIVEAIAKAIKTVLRGIGPVVSVILGAVLTFVSGVALLALSVASGMLFFGIQSPYVQSAVPLDVLATNPLYYVGLASAFLVALIPLALLLTLAVTLLTRRNQFRGASVGVMMLVWFLAIGTAAGTGAHVVPQIRMHAEAYNAERTVTQEMAIDDAVETLRVTGNAHVRVTHGDVPSATFRGWEEDLAQLSVAIEDGVLTIDQPELERVFLCLFCNRLRPRGELVLPALTAVVAHDNTDVFLDEWPNDLMLTADHVAHVNASFNGDAAVTLVQSGYSRVTLEGTAATLQATVRNTARLFAHDFYTETLMAHTSDYGHASVRTLGAFTATAEDASTITYRGNPATSTIQTLNHGRVDAWYGH